MTGWSRARRGEGDVGHEVIKFETIKNVGRGAALHVHLGGMQEIDGRPTAILSTKRLPILAVNETSDVNGEITVWWKNVHPDVSGNKYLPISIRIFCWDSRGRRHETKYSLFIVELNGKVILTDDIAPGVALSTRTTVSKSVRALKIRAKLASIPGLRWLAMKSEA